MHLKTYTMLYVNYISVKLRKKKKQQNVSTGFFIFLKIQLPRRAVNTVILLHDTVKKTTKFMLASRKDTDFTPQL